MAGRWRKRNVWYPWEVCMDASKGVNVVQGNEATLTMQKSAEVIVPIRGRTESIGVLSMTEEGGND